MIATAAAVLALVLGMPDIVRADSARADGSSPPPAPTDMADPSDEELSHDQGIEARYRSLIGRALEEWELGNWNEARAHFAQAHQLIPNARTLRAIGVAAFESRQYVDAVVHLEAALDDPRRPLTPIQRTDLQRILERARGYLARFELTMLPGTELLVDGHPAVVRGEVLLLDAGSHELVASLAGHQPQLRHIEATPGQEGKLNLEPIPEGQAEGQAASSTTSPHRTSTPTASDGSTGSGGLMWTWIGVALTGALAITTVGFHVAANDAAESVRRECAREPCTDTDLEALRDASSLDAYETVRTVGLVSALAMLAGTGVALALELSADQPASSSEDVASFRPWYTPEGTGVTVSLEF